MSKTGPLDFEASIDAKTFNAMLDEMERRIKGTTSTVVNEGDKIDETFRNIAAGITAYFGANLIGDLTSQMTQIRGEFQQLEIAFETMLKNKALSDKLMAEVVQFAAKTPFDLQQVATGAKQLLAYGTQSTEVVKTMRQLGDVAAGLSIPFSELVYLYGTSATQGKLMTKDLMQFAGRGIPIIDELSKTLDVSKSRVLELASEGKIGFTDLQEVISNLTSEGGMFAGMMEKQAASIPGLLSNMGDAWDQMMNDIGKANQGTIEEVIKTATSAVTNYQRVIDILKVVVASYGSYRAAVMLNSIAINGFSKALGVAAIKQQVLNVLQKSNPWGLALAGITALVGGLWAYNRSLDDTGKRLKEFSSQTTDAVAESNALFDRLKKTTIGTQEREAAIRKLESVHGDYIRNLNLEKAALGDIEIAQKAANDEMVRGLAIKAADEEKQQWYKKQLEIIKQINEAGFDFNEIIKDRGFKPDEYDEFGKRNTRVFVSYGQQVDNLLAAYDEVQLQKNKIDETYNKIIEGFGSGTPPPEVVEDTTEKSKQTLAQKLKEIQQMYETYYQWVERYGKESADKQFATLIKGGQSYLEYLESQIKTLENKPVKSTQDVSDLSTYLGTKDDLTGAKTRIQLFEEEVDSAKEKYTDLVDYINYLKGSLLAVGAFDGSEFSFEKIRILYEKMTEAEKEFAKESLNTYKTAVEKAADFSKKRILIEQEYEAEKKKLDQNGLGDEDYNEAIAALEKIRSEKLNLINSEEIKAGEAYKKLAGELGKIGRSEAQSYLKKLEEQLESLDKQSDAYKAIKDQIERTKDLLDKGLVEGLNQASNELRSMAEFASLFDEELGGIINNVSQIASGLSAIASGNYFSGVLQIMTAVFSTIINASENAARKAEEYRERVLERLSDRLSDINTLLERQISLIDELSGSDKVRAYADSFKDLRREIADVLNQINELEVSKKGYRGVTNLDLDPLINSYREIYGNGRVINEMDRDIIDRLISENQNAINQLYEEILNGDITGDKAEELKLLIEQLEANTESFEDLKDQYNEYITGTTSDSVIDSIISGFEQGEFAAEDFAETFEELMKKAMLQAVKMKYLEAPLKEWYETFASYSENGLTPEEIAALREAYNTIINSAAAEAQNIQNITGAVAGMEDTLTGQIKGITSEEAGLLVGQMNAIRINQAHALTLMDEQLVHLSEIASNTRYNRLLVDIKNILQSGKSNSANTNRAAGGE